MRRRYAVISLGLAVSLIGRCPGWTLTGDGCRIGFSERNGALESICGVDGIERVRPAKDLFSLCLLDVAGEESVFTSSDFSFSREGSRFAYCHTNGLRVVVDVRADHGALCVRPRVSGCPVGMRLNWCDVPHVNVSTGGLLYWPYEDGCEVSDYTVRTNKFAWERYRDAGWVERCTAAGGYYPGTAQMQFLAHYRDGRGLYFAAHDEKHVQKLVEWEYRDKSTARLTLQTLCGDAREGVWAPDFDYVLRPYCGGWKEACELHRDWVRTLPEFAAAPSLPEWAEDSPITLIYAVKGEGMDNTVGMAANRYYPYTNALVEVDRYAKLFDSRIMAVLMHWEGTAPWCPPYVWPPYGGESALAAFRDALHSRGHLLGLYCSGTAWTQVSCVDPSYSRSQQFVQEGLARCMMRGPKGQIDASICNHTRAQRFGYDLCLCVDWSRRTLLDEVMKIARFGVDYCQFFDQNLGGGPNRCWSGEHGHPPVPGAWMTDAMSNLQESMVASIRKAGSGMTIGCEGAAATPFVKNLYFNDSRSFFPRRFGRSVPGVSYVLHEWMCNFSGNQVAVRSDENFRWAYSFHCGDMLSAVLGPDGKLVTAWAVPWSEPLPDQDELIALIRSLNSIRKRYPQYLLRGRMMRPPFGVETGSVVVGRGDCAHEYDEVLWSYWQAPSGECKGFATNWQRHPAQIRIRHPGGRCETRRVGALETIEF